MLDKENLQKKCDYPWINRYTEENEDDRFAKKRQPGNEKMK